MKRIILISILVLSILASNAQQAYQSTLSKSKFEPIGYSTFDCLFEYQVSTKDKSDKPVVETYNTILQVGNDVAKFWDYTAFAADSVAYLAPKATSQQKEEFTKKMRRQLYFFDETIIQGYPANKITTIGVITPNNYIFTQDINKLEWQLYDDTLSVCGYVCRKATASYGGREWTAWYAQDIPSSAGPWKLSGLPGLILQASDSSGIHRFKAIAIRKNALPIYLEKNAQRVAVSRDKFLQNKVDFEKDPFKNIPVEAVSVMTVVRYGDGPTDKTALINGVQLRIRPNGYTPLELK